LAIEPGTVIAKRYQVVRLLGKGGMGEVFAAENIRTGRRVAIKVLRAEAKSKGTAIERFRREAKAAGAINSDFVTQVLDVEDDPEQGIVLVFELLEGESLVERLKRTGAIPFEELWGIVEAVWMGLADAHAAGVIHRDLKPSNVFLVYGRGGAGPTRVKLLDFGISKLPKEISPHSLTQVGQSLGTFSFMPPEQIGKAKTVDHRADIYACATLIYQALTTKLPYVAKNVVAMMELKHRSEPRKLADALGGPADPELEAFVARGLARSADARFQTALEALEAWRKLRPAGAVSQLDIAASGTYPQLEPPSSPSFSDAADTRRQPAPSPAVVAAIESEGSTSPSIDVSHETPPSASSQPPPATSPPGPDGAPPLARAAELQLLAGGTVPLPASLLARIAEHERQSADARLALPGPPPAAAEPARHPGSDPAPTSGPLPAPTLLTASGATPRSSSPPPPWTAPEPRPSGARMALLLVLSALGLMLLGFVTVAVVLRLVG
jgi:serine/threonine-protein kinase